MHGEIPARAARSYVIGSCAYMPTIFNIIILTSCLVTSACMVKFLHAQLDRSHVIGRCNYYVSTPPKVKTAGILPIASLAFSVSLQILILLLPRSPSPGT
jgi:hypothetical protein